MLELLQLLDIELRLELEKLSDDSKLVFEDDILLQDELLEDELLD